MCRDGRFHFFCSQGGMECRVASEYSEYSEFSEFSEDWVASELSGRIQAWWLSGVNCLKMCRLFCFSGGVIFAFLSGTAKTKRAPLRCVLSM